MERIILQDEFSVDPDGKPSRVTDFSLTFPHDFKQIEKPEFLFKTDRNNIHKSFSIASGTLLKDISTLRKMKKVQGISEHAILNVNNQLTYYQTNEVLTGEKGMGFQVTPCVPINDYLHTHSVREGEDEKVADLFSASDLWSMTSKGIERSWLVGRNNVWTLENKYGFLFYFYNRNFCLEMAKKYDSKNPYNELFSNLLECVKKCQYRLYKSGNSVNYTLVD